MLKSIKNRILYNDKMIDMYNINCTINKLVSNDIRNLSGNYLWGYIRNRIPILIDVKL